MTENFVAAELSKHGYPLHYYDKKSRQELDFVFESSTGIKIIEVKSGKNYKTHASINTAISECDLISSAVVLSQGNVERGESVIYMPLYMAMFM